MIKRIKIDPFAYVRRTKADCWKKRPEVLKYYASKEELKLKIGSFKLPNCYRVTFGVPFPKSYSVKKRSELEGRPHQLKPDLDNYLKGFQDSLRENDQEIYEVHARKVWSREGFIEIDCFTNI